MSKPTRKSFLIDLILLKISFSSHVVREHANESLNKIRYKRPIASYNSQWRHICWRSPSVATEPFSMASLAVSSWKPSVSALGIFLHHLKSSKKLSRSWRPTYPWYWAKMWLAEAWIRSQQHSTVPGASPWADRWTAPWSKADVGKTWHICNSYWY